MIPRVAAAGTFRCKVYYYTRRSCGARILPRHVQVDDAQAVLLLCTLLHPTYDQTITLQSETFYSAQIATNSWLSSSRLKRQHPASGRPIFPRGRLQFDALEFRQMVRVTSTHKIFKRMVRGSSRLLLLDVKVDFNGSIIGQHMPTEKTMIQDLVNNMAKSSSIFPSENHILDTYLV